tara:strand:- start:12542 stop:13321 length:780 start_codon:yes stop_codon:yes gene_type:complete
MTLLVNGCSFSYGDELTNHEEERYSTHLGNHLGMDVINASWPGSSNERIWRTTKRKLFSHRNIEKCLILWSDLARVESVHIEASMVTHSINKNHNNPLYDNNGDLKRPDPFFQFSPARLNSMPWKILKAEYEDYYSRVYTNETGICKTFNYMQDIAETCNLLGIDYYQGWFHQGNKYTIEKTFNQYNLNVKGPRLELIKEYVDNIDSTFTGNQRIGFDNATLTFEEFTDKNNLKKMPLGHPGPEAHKEYAKYLYDNFMR